jgi:disulfide oxidoreductase YuzD
MAESIFINADLFDFATPWLSLMAEKQEEAWIERQFGGTAFELNPVNAILGPSRESLKRAWLEHLRKENMLLPIVVHDANVNNNSASEEQLLRHVGFARIEIVARAYQSAVLVAGK